MPYKKSFKPSKKIFAIFFAIFSVLTISPALSYNIFSADNTFTIGEFNLVEYDKKSTKLFGAGTEDNPFEIYSIYDLYCLEYNTNHDKGTYYNQFINGYFKLMNNIDCGELSLIPICAKTKFKGVFDGNGYAILNYSLYYSDTINNKEVFLGFFGQNLGIIKNLTISGELYVNTSRISQKIYVGAVCGYNLNSVSSCCNNARVDVQIWSSSTNTVNAYVGGIVGCSEKNISTCCNNGIVNFSGTDSETGYVGGIVGRTQTQASISWCGNFASFDTGANFDIGTIYCGGIVGRVDKDLSIDYTYNTGNIEVRAKNCTVGGIVGFVSSAKFTNCYNTGDIYARSENVNNTCFAGGIIGECESTVQLSNVYTNCNTISSSEYSGGLVGKVSNLTANSCYVNATEIKGLIKYNSPDQKTASLDNNGTTYSVIQQKMINCSNYFVGSYIQDNSNITLNSTYYHKDIEIKYDKYTEKYTLYGNKDSENFSVLVNNKGETEFVYPEWVLELKESGDDRTLDFYYDNNVNNPRIVLWEYIYRYNMIAYGYSIESSNVIYFHPIKYPQIDLWEFYNPISFKLYNIKNDLIESDDYSNNKYKKDLINLTERDQRRLGYTYVEGQMPFLDFNLWK